MHRLYFLFLNHIFVLWKCFVSWNKFANILILLSCCNYTLSLIDEVPVASVVAVKRVEGFQSVVAKLSLTQNLI